MNSPGKIFLTGATGFIGKALARRLTELGWQVHALVRDPQKAGDLRHPNLTLFKGDLDDRRSVEEAMDGCTRVFHLAAYARAWAPDPVVFEETNYVGGLNILEVALAQGVMRVVTTSTAGVFGHSRDGTPTTEESEGEEHLMTTYERSKSKLEKAIGHYIAEGLQVVVVNPARVFGPGPLDQSNGETMVIQKYLQGRFRFLPGDGSSTGSYVNVDDVVNGHLLAMEKGRSGERYILGGENASFREFFDAIGRISGHPRRMFDFPIPLIMAFARLQLFLANRFGRPPVLTPELVRKYVRRWDFSSEKAARELGYTFRPLEQSLRETIEWLEKENLVK